jgi:hypothetical protein
MNKYLLMKIITCSSNMPLPNPSPWWAGLVLLVSEGLLTINIS